MPLIRLEVLPGQRVDSLQGRFASAGGSPAQSADMECQSAGCGRFV